MAKRKYGRFSKKISAGAAKAARRGRGTSHKRSIRDTKAGQKIGRVMHEFKEGKLRSSSGHKIKKRSQAIAIGLSEARERGLKVPARKSKSSGGAKGRS